MITANVTQFNNYTPAEITEIKKINLSEWAKQSRTYLNTIYNTNGHKMDISYINSNAKNVKVQLYKAGLRLASVLEKCFE